MPIPIGNETWGKRSAKKKTIDFFMIFLLFRNHPVLQSWTNPASKILQIFSTFSVEKAVERPRRKPKTLQKSRDEAPQPVFRAETILHSNKKLWYWPGRCREGFHPEAELEISLTMLVIGFKPSMLSPSSFCDSSILPRSTR